MARARTIQTSAPRIDGNDKLFFLVEQAADFLVDLIREAEARDAGEVEEAANRAYAQVLDISNAVRVFLERKLTEVK